MYNLLFKKCQPKKHQAVKAATTMAKISQANKKTNAVMSISIPYSLVYIGW